MPYHAAPSATSRCATAAAAEWPEAARDLARALAQLRRRPAARVEPRDPPARLRPGRHPFRPGEQLRAAVRVGRGDVRPDHARGPAPVPRRARDLDEGRLRHVAGPVRRVGLAEVPARVARPVARADGPRLRRHLLLAPLRPRDAARGDARRARHGGQAGQGALRRHLVVLGRAHARGGRDPARARHAPAHPPAVLFAAEPLDRAGSDRRARRARRRLHLVLAARPGHAHRQVPRRDSRGLARLRRTPPSPPRCSPTRRAPRSGR